MSTAEEKVPGGKLVRVTLLPDGRVEITGDFFLHPEEGITHLENALRRLDGTTPSAEIERLLYGLIGEENLELLGVDVPAIVRLYQRCLTCGE
jgi:lipoate-protein ligase A